MSTIRIKGSDGVVIESTKYLELPKAPTKITTDTKRAGMIRYNDEWKAFEGTIEFTDESIEYRRFAHLDENGRLQTSQLPDSLISGLKYIGTYSPLTDDIDPPVTAGVYDKLPAPDASNSGNYYIIRGIYDSAVQHYKTSTPSTSPVIFTPTNPSGAGNWIQIKYYFSTDPVTPSTNIITSAFARIISSAIPTTGHEGLLSLASDTDLTSSFTNDNEPMSEIAISDTDWVISSEVKWIRQRSSRVSILASAVIFDRTLMYSNNRVLADVPSGTSQNILDSLIMNGLRRTGDSMYDSGAEGDGRLAFLYGTASEPSLTFNNNDFDPESNSGIDPTKWSDPSTGIFHPDSLGSIGFTSSAVEKLRITPSQVIFYASSTASASNPNILFSGTANNNLGLVTLNDRVQFVSDNTVNISIAPAATTFYGTLTTTGNILSQSKITAQGDFAVNGNSTIGDASTDTLTVNATSKFIASVSFNGNTTIGDASSDTLTVNATSTFAAPITATSITTGNLTVTGNTLIGDASTDTLTINATSSFVAPITGTLTVNATSTFNAPLTGTAITTETLTVTGNTILGDASTDTLAVKASSIFSNTSNTFAGAQIVSGAALTFQGTNTSTISKTGTSLNLTMINFDDVSIIDGANTRTKFGRYGIKLPVLTPVSNSNGEDGMIAFSTDLNTVIQKVSGIWKPVGTPPVINAFTNATWVLNGSYYQIVYTVSNAVMVQVQQLETDNSFTLVDVDTVSITGTTVTIKVPATPDMRFAGRCVITTQ